MLDCLGRRQKACIEGRRALELLHDLGAFIGDAVDGVADLAARRFADDLEDLLKPRNLAAGFALVLGESGLELARLRSLRHFRQRLQNLVLSVIDVFESVLEKVLKGLRLSGHGYSKCWAEITLLAPHQRLPARRVPFSRFPHASS